MEHTRDAMGTIRRIAIRVGLEVVQGIGARNTKNPYATEEIPSNVEESLNIPYINREGVPLAMDIFKPIGEQYEGKELPVIVCIHGGGLVTGDRKISFKLARDMASRGYLVFAIEYRLAPRATLCEQLDDICAGLDYVGQKIVDYDVDFTRMFMTADSAGAFLAIYTAAMKKSKKLQDAIGYKPSRMTFKALGLSCGMYYTNRDDILGYLLAEQFYGDKFDDKKFLQYMNPEHPEIVHNLPPTFLVTAQGDFLNNYTLMFHKALKKAGKTTKLLYYGESDLAHTFNFSHPDLPQSKDANDKMLAFFEEQADSARAKQKVITKNKERIKEIGQEIKSGSFAKQKLWKAVYSINSEIDDNLESVAIVADDRKYTYRQMFRQWQKYAEVFSALGMTEKNNACVGIPGAMTTEAISAFYALNMTGAKVSMLPYLMLENHKDFLEVVKEDKITDLVLTDYEVTPKFLEELVKCREDIGLKNIVILKTDVCGPCAGNIDTQNALTNYKKLRQIKGVEFMPELLMKYEATPISYSSDDASVESVILYKPLEQQGIYVPVAFSDEEINSYVFKTEYEKHKSHRFVGLTLDLYTAHSLVKQVHQSFLLNDSLQITYKAGYNNDYFKAIGYYNIDTIIIYSSLIEQWIKESGEKSVNFASLDYVYIEDDKASKDDIGKYKEYICKNDGNADVSVSTLRAKDYSEFVSYKFENDNNKVQTSLNPYPGFIPMLPQTPYAMGMAQIAQTSNDMLKMQQERNEKMNKRMQILNKVLPELNALLESIKNSKNDDEGNGEAELTKGLMKILAVFFDTKKIDYYFER
jgi:acetyl esterase/lipase